MIGGEPLSERKGHADDAGRPAVVLVLGMHRSGTSAVAEAIVRLGVPVGDGVDLVGPDEWNARGSFEDSELNRINDAILDELGGDWSAPPLEVDTRRPLSPELLDRMRSYVEGTTRSSKSCYMWKDPRLCITLPFWRPLLGRVIAVLVWRHPCEVADSLRERNRLPVPCSCLLWEVYNRCAIANSADVPRVILSYAEFVRSPVPVLQRLQAMLLEQEILKSPGGVERAAEAIDPDLRHHRYDSGAEEAAVMLSRSQVRLLESLRRKEIPELDYPIESWNMLLVEHRRLAAERDDLERRLVHVSNEKRLYEDSYRYIMNKPGVRAYRAVKGFLQSLLGRRGAGRPGGEA